MGYNKRNKNGNLVHIIKKGIIFTAVTVLLLSVLMFSGCSATSEENGNSNNTAAEESATQIAGLQIPVELDEKGEYLIPESPIKGAESLYKNAYIISNPEEIDCLVNRTYNLPKDYEPEDLVECKIPFAPGREQSVHRIRKEAEKALEKMYAAAEKEGLEFYAASGYRSYEIQRILFGNSIIKKGSVEAASEYNAAPGQSEHQLGLAMDFTTESLDYTLRKEFENTDEGIWLKENCADFGFILRYPENSEEITGYSHEPWHFRYVGREIAEKIMSERITLEEYYSSGGK